MKTKNLFLLFITRLVISFIIYFVLLTQNPLDNRINIISTTKTSLMTYGLTRIIHFFLLVHSIFSIPAAVLSFAFVSLDFISFIIQLVGGSYAGPTAPVEEQMKGMYIYMGGIGLQQFFIFMFLGLAVKFHLMMVRLERVGVAKRGWKRLLWTLYARLAFISVSSLFLLCLTVRGLTTWNRSAFSSGS